MPRCTCARWRLTRRGSWTWCWTTTRCAPCRAPAPASAPPLPPPRSSRAPSARHSGEQIFLAYIFLTVHVVPRPSSQSGRPLSGVSRPGSQAARPGTMEAALRTPRTARTARPVSATSARFVRLGTASMLSQVDSWISGNIYTSA